jgi:hypothetical protein
LAFAGAASLGEGTPPMLKLLGVTVLQPEQVIGARVPGGADAIGALLTSLQRILHDAYADTTEPGSRTLSIALAPNRRLELWLATDDETAITEEEARLRELAQGVDAPDVVDGPVALALVFAVGTEAPAEAQLTLPEPWRRIVQASDTVINVEQILTRLWTN